MEFFCSTIPLTLHEKLIVRHCSLVLHWWKNNTRCHLLPSRQDNCNSFHQVLLLHILPMTISKLNFIWSLFQCRLHYATDNSWTFQFIYWKLMNWSVTLWWHPPLLNWQTFSATQFVPLPMKPSWQMQWLCKMKLEIRLKKGCWFWHYFWNYSASIMPSNC